MKYAVGFLLTKITEVSVTSHSLHVHEADTPQQAIGHALLALDKIRPGYAASDPLVIDCDSNRGVKL